MSGQLLYIPHGGRMAQRDHVHCTWRLRQGRQSGRMSFRDPRRFGGVWLYKSMDSLIDHRWAGLGPDAIDIGSSTLRHALGSSRRSIKAALLDQSLVAGVGNIYADEALHRAGIHPLCQASRLVEPQWRALAGALRRILRAAVTCGGSTFRDYRDGRGDRGRFAARHQVYGRGGQPCRRCRTLLQQLIVGQRTTVFCPCCQQRRQGPRPPNDPARQPS
jgi:formamidopyrimidine-DNA glycosylase